MCRYDNIEIEMIIDVVFSDKWKILYKMSYCNIKNLLHQSHVKT